MPLQTDGKLTVMYACDPYRDVSTLDPGGRFLSPDNARLVVVMVCEVPEENLSWFRKRLMPPHQLVRQVAAQEGELQERMFQVVSQLEGQGYEVDSRVRRGKGIGEVLVAVAEELNVDLIVAERRRQSAWQRMLVGSVTDYLNRHARQSLLIL